MKVYQLIVLSALIVVPLATLRAAMESAPVSGDNSPKVTGEESPQVQTHTVEGAIIALDTVSQKLTVQGPDGPQEFQLGTTTPLTDKFKPVGFRDLDVGERVAV